MGHGQKIYFLANLIRLKTFLEEVDLTNYLLADSFNSKHLKDSFDCKIEFRIDFKKLDLAGDFINVECVAPKYCS